MQKLYTPSHVANFFLRKAREEGVSITQLKLLKIVYIAYGWVLAMLGERLFNEPIQAWKLGPVVPSLYHEFKRFSQFPIDTLSMTLDDDQKTLHSPEISADDECTVILDKVWDVYKVFSARALVDKTHEVDTPWSKHYRPGVRDIPIPDEDIKDYFTQKITEYLSVRQ